MDEISDWYKKYKRLNSKPRYEELKPNMDLSMCDLSMRDLSGVNLSGCNLFGADLYGTNFMGANLEGAILNHAFIPFADFSGANVNIANGVLVPAHGDVEFNVLVFKEGDYCRVDIINEFPDNYDEWLKRAEEWANDVEISPDELEVYKRIVYDAVKKLSRVS